MLLAVICVALPLAAALVWHIAAFLVRVSAP
jgi:hypothetical protein